MIPRNDNSTLLTEKNVPGKKSVLRIASVFIAELSAFAILAI
jgi:hypothetical protein